MYCKKIKKRSGGIRKIYVPSKSEKKYLRQILRELETKVRFEYYVQGFVQGSNIITNAKMHLNYDVTISFDLKDFFDTCNNKHLPEHLEQYEDKIKHKVCPDKWTAQGLPTSPMICNILAEKLDDKIFDFLSKIHLDFTYSRYADDISISFNLIGNSGSDFIKYIIKHISDKVKSAGFQLNKKKTKVQYSTAGRREICGVMVDNTVHISRRQRRKIRAAKHNYAVNPGKENKKRLDGLLEFAKLKEPNAIQALINKDISNICKNIFVLEKCHISSKVRSKIINQQKELLNKLSCYKDINQIYKKLYKVAAKMLQKEVQ